MGCHLMLATRTSSLALLVLCLAPATGCRNPELFDYDGDGVVDADDCAPQDSLIFPGADEDCSDGLDNDCDGDVDAVDDDCQADDDDVVHDDNDYDGYSIDEGDCDDNDPDINPGEVEVPCDGLDNDCTDETTDEPDLDGDSYTSCPGAEQDCDDGDVTVHPGAEETCGNGIDDNCDGDVNGCTYSGPYGLGQATARLLGEDEHNEAGKAIGRAGDLNADGFADILIGATQYGLSEGASYIVYGPIVGDMDLSLAAVRFVGEVDSFSGNTVNAGGDVDGDGWTDMLVGASDVDGDFVDTGAVYVLTDLQAGGQLAQLAAATIGGNEGGVKIGRSAAIVGDTNGDGTDDILIGAYKANGQSGTAYLFYGPFSGTMSVTDADVRVDGVEDHGSVGASVGPAGDVNLDGYADWLVSMPYAQGGGVMLFHGGVDVAAAMTMDDADGVFHEGGGDFGWGMGAGDMDMDGVPDLAATGERIVGDLGGLYLHSGPLQGTVDLLYQVDGRVVLEPEDRRLNQLSLDGDVNGDGGADLLVGEYCDLGVLDEPGAAYLFLEDFNGEIGLTDAAASFVGEANGDCAGSSVAFVGDVAGDGYDDLLIAALYADIAGTDAGAVYLFASGGWL